MFQLFIKSSHFQSLRLLLFILLFEVMTSARAQSYYFRHYQVEEGLSNNTVFCSAQDSRGFLWLGTKDGLNRFDGYSFKTFRKTRDTNSIGDNFIRSIYIDHKDHVYAGTRNGLYKFDPVTEKFSKLYNSNEEIRDIRQETNGITWIVAGQSLVKLFNNQVKKYPVTATSIAIDSLNNIWIATPTGFIIRKTSKEEKFDQFDLFASEKQAFPKWIEKISITPNGTILAGTSNFGVKEFYPSTGKYKNLITYNPDRTGIFARDFTLSGNDLWIATESGIFVYNTRTNNYQNLRKELNNPYSVSDNAIYTLCRDKEGGIWAGTYFGGLNYFPRQYASFEKFIPGFNEQSLSGNAVREITKDKYGSIWIGTEDAGLNQWDPQKASFKKYKPTGAATDISYPNIHGLLAEDDKLWIGTFEHGLDVMHIPSGKIVGHYPSHNDPSLPKSTFVVVLFRSANGTIYIGTRQGLYRFNRSTNSFDNVAAIPSNAFIHTIAEDYTGTVWVGTMGNGLFYFNEKEKGGYVYDPATSGGLTSNSITTIFPSGNYLWIGTEGGGLCLMDLHTRKIVQAKNNQGLPSNTIFKILDDSKKRLWITTSNGLVCYDPVSGKMGIFTTANGLLSNQFNYNSGYKDEQGNMYFGSARGMVRFNPDSFSTNKFIPPVLITGLYINDKEIQIGKATGNRSVSVTDKIELNPNQSSFSIDFAALSYTSPGMTEYQYIMEGLDKEWTYLKTNRKVYFTDLSPGNYTFKVKASAGNGQWNGPVAEMNIEVLPPFYASKLAYTIYAILSIALIIYLFRSYHERLNEKTRRKIEALEHEKEKAIYQAKIEFFTNVAHEIKTPLTLIKAPMEKIVKKEGHNPELGSNLRIMERNTDRLIELTNQLLDFRRVEAKGFGLDFSPLSINELLSDCHAGFRSLAEQKNISLRLFLPSKDIIAHVDLDSIQKIINNLLSNAINYCHHEVEVHLFDRGDYFSIEVSNDGQSIPADMKQKIFEPFVRLNNSNHKSGTGIGLALTKSLVDLHNGSIELKDAEPGKIIFVLTLPIKHRNPQDD